MPPWGGGAGVVLAVLVATVGVVLDLVTKRLAAIHFVDAPIEIIPGVLTFTYGENPGAAFSMFQDGGTLFGVAALVAVGVILWSVRQPRPTLEVVGLGLIMGGAVGNLVDRIARGEGLLDGHVIDWIQFPNFPVFNLADSGITVGVALMIIAAWQASRQVERG